MTHQRRPRPQWNDDESAARLAYDPGMPRQEASVPIEDITRRIYVVRGIRVMLDADLAELYGVQTRALNQAVRRNAARFPGDFILHLSHQETRELQRSRSQSVILSWGRNVKYRATAFTEHGAVMAATVLNSPRAVQMSIFVVRAFLRLREWVSGQAELAARLAELERKVGAHDHELKAIIQAIRELLEPAVPPRKRIGFRRAN
jgi:hypothetical protein